jgi:hypothetical protein
MEWQKQIRNFGWSHRSARHSFAVADSFLAAAGGEQLVIRP